MIHGLYEAQKVNGFSSEGKKKKRKEREGRLQTDLAGIQCKKQIEMEWG